MKRWQIIAFAAVALIAIAVVTGYRMGVKLLQNQIVSALGPGSRVAELKVNWFSVELFGLSIDGPKGWPAKRTLEAERVVVIPDLRSLLTDQIRIASIVVERPYLSMLRTPGKLVLVPSLTEREPGRKDRHSSGNGARTVMISTIEIKDGTLEVYDATVSRPPLKTRVESIEAVLQDVAAPAAERTSFDIAGVVKGVRRDGRLQVNGWVGSGARDSSSRIALAAADLVALQPYLIKRNEARVANGTLDLNLNSEVRNNNLDGKGAVVLRNLEFAPSRGFFDTFMGLPRNAVVGFLKDNNNAIDIDFTLKGDTSNPNFSLNEDLSTRIATAMAGQLGVSIRDMAEGLGTIGRRGMEGAGGVVEGVGSAIKRLFASGN
jgi:hypothetical protein